MKLSEFNPKELLRIFGIYLIWTGWAFGLLFYCVSKIIDGSGLESFRLGNVPVYKFYNTSYIEVAIYCGSLIVAIAIGFYVRYITYGEELHFKKTFDIKEDRKFSDDFFDSSSGGNGDGGGGD